VAFNKSCNERTALAFCPGAGCCVVSIKVGIVQPWQKDILERYSTHNIKMTMSMGRQSGKSDWLNMLRNFMERPEKRFQLASSPYGGQSCLLMIQDYMWWSENEREIYNWMADNLPRGIEHQQGMVISFDTDKQRMMFLLRWA
jgi:hypothetical protein